MSVDHVAVLGAGLMGTATALMLARSGVRVTLFEGQPAPMQGASRWNEGKIHLGYLYAADGSLSTARRVLPGGVAFMPIIESLIGESLNGHFTEHDDLYLIHRDSVVPLESVSDYFNTLTREIRSQAATSRYLCDLSRADVQHLNADEFERLDLPPSITGGFRVPERSVDTIWIADRLAAALEAEPLVELLANVQVNGARPLCDERGSWDVLAQNSSEGPFDWVVNALWFGRLAVDVSAGLSVIPGWSHRHRLSVFASTHRPLALPSAVVGFGPFGDVKNYDGRHFYLSWYPAGLTVESGAVAPPTPPPIDPVVVAAATRAGLGSLLPWIEEILDNATRVDIRGGWVFAQGCGSLEDPTATLHRRDLFGIRRRGRYLSVDTGKYSSAPLLAARLSATILGRPLEEQWS